jgi:DNA-directed RNA polymerase specialized sigma24 family protein
VLAVVREHKVEYNNTLKLSALRRRSTEELDAEAVAAIEDPQDNPEAAIQNRQTSEILLKCLEPISKLPTAVDPI